MNYIYTFRYAGNKTPFLDTIFSLLLSIKNREQLIEPFGGSGVVSVNASKFFKSVYLNDLCRELICIHRMLKESKWHDHQMFMAKHGDFQFIKRKNYYYAFREKFNREFWKSDTITEGIFLYYIAGACINSMFRLGPNGFNQGAANQSLSKIINPLLLKQFNKAYQNINLSTKDAYDLFNEFSDDENITWFIDPPYNNTTLTYGLDCDKRKLIDVIINLKGNVIYTDSFNEAQDKIMTDCGFKSIVLRNNMPNIAVGGKGEQYENRKEMLYYKINKS